MKIRILLVLAGVIAALVLLTTGCDEGKTSPEACGHYRTATYNNEKDHAYCNYCNRYICQTGSQSRAGLHGDGKCNVPMASGNAPMVLPQQGDTEPATNQPVELPPALDPNASPEPTPTPAPLSSDGTLREFTAVFPDGTAVDMKDPKVRQNIVVVGQSEVTVTAAASHPKANVAGDTGTLPLAVGENGFTVTVRAENGDVSYFRYTITVEEPELPSAPSPFPEYTYVPTSGTDAEIIDCPQCGEPVNAVTSHLGDCGVPGHYWCTDGEEHPPIECGIQGHTCDGTGAPHSVFCECGVPSCVTGHVEGCPYGPYVPPATPESSEPPEDTSTPESTQ